MVNMFRSCFIFGVVAVINAFPLRDYGTSMSSSTYYIGRFPGPPHIESSSNIITDSRTSSTTPTILNSDIEESSQNTVTSEDGTTTTPVDGTTTDENADRTTSPPNYQLDVLSTTYTTSWIETQRSWPISAITDNSLYSDSNHVTEESSTSGESWTLESTDDDYTVTSPTTRANLDTSTAVEAFTTIGEQPTTVLNLNTDYTPKQTTIVDQHTSTVQMVETKTTRQSETTPVFRSTTLPVIETTEVALDSTGSFTEAPIHTTTDAYRDTTTVVDQDSDTSTTISALEDRDSSVGDDVGSDSWTSSSTLEEYTTKPTTVHELETTPVSLGDDSLTDIEPSTVTLPYQETTIASPKHHRQEMDNSVGTASTTDQYDTTVSSRFERKATSTKSHFVDILLNQILKDKFAKKKIRKQKYLQNPIKVTTKLTDDQILVIEAILRSRHHK